MAKKENRQEEAKAQEKVPQVEYATYPDQQDANAELRNYEQLRTEGLGSGGWKVGEPAPTTLFYDYDQEKVVDTQPGRGYVIVNEGQPLTLDVLRQLQGE